MPSDKARIPPTGERTTYTHYGRRRGRKLRSGRQHLVDTLLPELRVPVTGLGNADSTKFSEIRKKFSSLWLEIGFGQGEHIAAQAQGNPDTLLIGCEPYVNGVSSLLRTIDAEAIDNILIHDEDARILLDALPDASVRRLFLLFPDPWPKSRHHKRRFISTTNLDRISRVLEDGAEFRFATDHPGYARWALWYILNHVEMEWPAERAAEWRVRPLDWPATRYEEKAQADGRACTYLTFRRRVSARQRAERVAGLK